MADSGLIYVIFVLHGIYVCVLFPIFGKTFLIYISFMARLVLFFIAFIVPCVAECGGFRIKGDVGGLSGSTKMLVCYDIDIPVSYGFDYAVAGNRPLAEAPVNDGKFVISGHVASPALAYIIFCDAQASSFMDDTEARYVTLMIDNVDVDVSVVDVKKASSCDEF